MRCERARNVLVEYSEDLLPEDRRRAVEAHLSDCESCRRELEGIEKLKQSILLLDLPERDSEFWQAFTDKLSHRLAEEEAVTASRGLSWRSGFPLAAAVAGMIALVAVLLFFVVKGEWDHDGISRVARETSDVEFSGQTASDLQIFEDDIYFEPLLAQVDPFNGYDEQQAEDIFLLIEEDLFAAEEEMVVDSIYEQDIYDLLEDLSHEEFEEMYDDLASI